MEQASAAGARLGHLEDEWISIDEVKRNKLSWFSKNVLTRLGVTKPAPGDACEYCGAKSPRWELDHTNPWRPYIFALLAGTGDMREAGGTTYVNKAAAKALYNDPANLVYICRTCNRAKSDKQWWVDEDGDVVEGERASRAPSKDLAI